MLPPLETLQQLILSSSKLRITVQFEDRYSVERTELQEYAQRMAKQLAAADAGMRDRVEMLWQQLSLSPMGLAV